MIEKLNGSKKPPVNLPAGSPGIKLFVGSRFYKSNEFLLEL